MAHVAVRLFVIARTPAQLDVTGVNEVMRRLEDGAWNVAVVLVVGDTGDLARALVNAVKEA